MSANCSATHADVSVIAAASPARLRVPPPFFLPASSSLCVSVGDGVGIVPPRYRTALCPQTGRSQLDRRIWAPPQCEPGVAALIKTVESRVQAWHGVISAVVSVSSERGTSVRRWCPRDYVCAWVRTNWVALRTTETAVPSIRVTTAAFASYPAAMQSLAQASRGQCGHRCVPQHRQHCFREVPARRSVACQGTDPHPFGQG